MKFFREDKYRTILSKTLKIITNLMSNCESKIFVESIRVFFFLGMNDERRYWSFFIQFTVMIPSTISTLTKKKKTEFLSISVVNLAKLQLPGCYPKYSKLLLSQCMYKNFVQIFRGLLFINSMDHRERMQVFFLCKTNLPLS